VPCVAPAEAAQPLRKVDESCRRLQVKSLYGPLLACLTTSRSAFDAMLKQHSPDGSRKALVAAIHQNPGCHEGEAYRWDTADTARQVTMSLVLQVNSCFDHAVYWMQRCPVAIVRRPFFGHEVTVKAWTCVLLRAAQLVCISAPAAAAAGSG
jgi:hypothetical protein